VVNLPEGELATEANAVLHMLFIHVFFASLARATSEKSRAKNAQDAQEKRTTSGPKQTLTRSSPTPFFHPLYPTHPC